MSIRTVKMVNYKANARDWFLLRKLNQLERHASISETIRDAVESKCRGRGIVYIPGEEVKTETPRLPFFFEKSAAPQAGAVEVQPAAAAVEVQPDTTVVARGPCEKCGRDRLLNGLGICDVCELSRHAGGNGAAAATQKPRVSKPARKPAGKTKAPVKVVTAKAKGKTRKPAPGKKKG